MLAQKDLYIASAYGQLQEVSRDKRKRLQYEARQKAILDHNQMMLEATRRGEEIGEKRGEERGKENGIKIGEERVNKLILLLTEENRLEDLKRSASDKDFQQQLMKKYGI